MSPPRLVPLPRMLHTTERPSATAQWTTLGRALELQRPPGERIVSDPFAPAFLSGFNRRALSVVASLTPTAVRRVEGSQLASIATSALCRHAFIDAHLLKALPQVDQVVILGAGYDSRAYRFTEAIGDRPVYEVDLAPLSRAKSIIVDAHPEQFQRGAVHRVEIDFRTESLHTRLAGSGFRLGAPTFVIWEGVSPYLDRRAVQDTLAALAVVCGSGSVLTMDCWQHLAGSSPYARVRRAAVRSMRLIGEPITFAVPSADVGSVLEPSGFRLTELADATRLTDRYATGGRTCDDGLYVLAAALHRAPKQGQARPV